MKILVIGSGGREHALVYRLKQSPRVKKIFCAPGNAGIGTIATCIDLAVTDISGLARFANKECIDLTVVGPEASLMVGIVDYFTKRGLTIFGPRKNAAVLEGSKAFTKKFMEQYGIPSGKYRVFSNRDSAIRYVEGHDFPLVIKADGLAAGKGVMVAHTVGEARDAIDLIMIVKAFGDAGTRVVVEEFLIGEEASFLAFTDGKTVLALPSSQDHKAIYDNDQGPNTGGMGAYSPAPVVTPAVEGQVMKEIMIPTVKAMAAEGRPYQGVLYAGLMIDKGIPRVLEFNCRFGDPEAQPLLMRLKTDLVDVLEAIIYERLHEISLDIDPRPSVCVVMAAGGYPGSYEKGRQIKGLDDVRRSSDIQVFHAGTAMKDGQLVTAGGRVLGVTALGATLKDAIGLAYETVCRISWDGCYFRKDIGQKALAKATDETRVGIVMGSDSDFPIMEAAGDLLKKMGITFEYTIASAHRTPERARDYALSARGRGLKVIIAGAGMAAHLAGVLAAHTTLPVIGVPIDASSLNGLDALLSTVQMPPGVPVATMGIGTPGARNAAILACQIMALSDDRLAGKLLEFKQEMVREVEKKADKLKTQ